MNPTRTTGCRKGKLAAFSLLELLTVLAILVVVMAFVLPSIKGSGNARALTAAGSAVEGELNIARETALVKRRPVEVRFYKTTVSGSSAYRAMQTFIQNDTGIFKELNKVVTLPSHIIIDENSTYSSLLDPDTCTTGTALKVQSLGSNITYGYFRFLPNGQTSLTSGTPPFFTLHEENVTNPETAGNFYTIQVDPVNGKLKNYRP